MTEVNGSGEVEGNLGGGGGGGGGAGFVGWSVTVAMLESG